MVELAKRLSAADDVVLADTIGVATPGQVRRLVEDSGASGFHGHNTRNTGFANAYAALEAGATTLDSSIGGLGGCPFAPKATGNVATEDLVYMLEGDGVETGADLDALIAISEWLEGVLGRQLEGQLYRAGQLSRASRARPSPRELDVALVRLADLLGDPDRGEVLGRDERDMRSLAELARTRGRDRQSRPRSHNRCPRARRAMVQPISSSSSPSSCSCIAFSQRSGSQSR